MAAAGDQTARIDRVEGEVQSIRTEIGGVKADVVSLTGDVRALGGILSRIEAGVQRAQEQSDHREQLRQPNVVALISVLVTVISIIVGGAWIISGSLAAQNERSEWMNRRFELQHERILEIERWRNRERADVRQAPE